ncbi:MAG: acetylxylan esterase, partial [Pirellulales bacterium]|nr:acetylxylan esterase [Pirellulales bacterium]
MPRTSLALVAAAILAFAYSTTWAASPRVLPEGKRPEDWRLGPLKDLNGYFPFKPAKTKEAWNIRADKLRRQAKVALGIWPEPTRTPLNAKIHGKINRDDYTIERAYFESVPGLYVTGNLYRPRDSKGKRPAVLCPHGHWAYGRFHDAGDAVVKRLIDDGAERFTEGGRSPLQARCVTLARLGCVVFHYDMIGYNDSQQISHNLAHRFAKQRPEANDASSWGFYSPHAESHLQSVMGLQIWNGIRALDFLESLPDVDPKRLAATGASGGGTQTMMLGAIDPRLAAIVPAVMVSTAMQGGCTCENCSLLRIGTGNVEFAALFAPKPQLLIAADDWTREMKTKG